MSFFIACLLCYGITNILVQGSIFESFKRWLIDKSLVKYSFYTAIVSNLASFILKIMNCPMCAGFHVGWFIGIFCGPFAWWNVIFNGAVFSGTTWIIFSIVQFLGNGDDPSRAVMLMTDEPIAIKDINKEDEEEDNY